MPKPYRPGMYSKVPQSTTVGDDYTPGMYSRPVAQEPQGEEPQYTPGMYSGGVAAPPKEFDYTPGMYSGPEEPAPTPTLDALVEREAEDFDAEDPTKRSPVTKLREVGRDIEAAAGELPRAVARGTEAALGTVGDIGQWFTETHEPGPIPAGLPLVPRKVANALNRQIMKIMPQWYRTRVEETHAKNLEMARFVSDFWREQASKGREAPRSDVEAASWAERPFTKAASAIGEAAPSYISAIAATIATKSAVVPALMFGLQEGGGTYAAARAAGQEIKKADLLGFVNGAWTAATEAVPFQRMLGRAGRGALERIAKGAIEEGVQELIQTVGSNVIEKIGWDKGRDIMDGWIEALVAGGALGGMGGGFIREAGRAPTTPTPPPLPAQPVTLQEFEHLERKGYREQLPAREISKEYQNWPETLYDPDLTVTDEMRATFPADTKYAYANSVRFGMKYRGDLGAAREMLKRFSEHHKLAQGLEKEGKLLDAVDVAQKYLQFWRESAQVAANPSKQELRLTDPDAYAIIYKGEKDDIRRVEKEPIPGEAPGLPEARAAESPVALEAARPEDPGAESNLLADAERLTEEARDAAADQERAAFVDITAAQPALDILRRTWANVRGHFRIFGKQQILAPELAKRAQRTYYDKLTVAERSVTTVHQLLKSLGPRSQEAGLAVTFAFEGADKSALPSDLYPLYDAAADLFDSVKSAQQAAGVLGKGFPEGTRAHLTEKIAELERSFVAARTPWGKAELARMRKELQQLERIKRYLPHGRIAKQFMDVALRARPTKQRAALYRALETLHRQRKGRLLLQDYLNLRDDQGKLIFDPNEFEIGRLMMDAYVDANSRLINKGYLDWLRQEGYLVHKDRRVQNEDDFIPYSDIDPRAQLQLGVDIDAADYKISRLAAGTLETLSKSDAKISGWFDKILATSKTGQFIHGGLIVSYDALQHFQGGAYILPWKSAANLKRAIQAVTEKNDTYFECLEGNVYQEPVLIAKSGIAQSAELMARQTITDLGGGRTATLGRQVAERLTGEVMTMKAWRKKGASLPLDALMIPLKSIATTTWTADRIIRTHSYLNLRQMGLSQAEAAEQTARIHGAYSKLGPGYRRWASRTFFVMSFRLLMPLQTIRGFTDLGKFAINRARVATGNKELAKISNAEGWRAAKAMIGGITIPTLLHSMFLSLGWEPVEEEKEFFGKGLQKFTRIPIGWGKHRIIVALPHWKYKRRYTDGEGQEREVVGSINIISNMFTKWLMRFRYGDVGKWDEPRQKFWNLIKWELHPSYHHLADIVWNKGSYEEVQPRGPDGRSWKGALEYGFRHTFRLYDALWNAFGRASGKESPTRKEQRETLKEQLNALETMILGTRMGTGMFGSAYTRQDRRDAALYYIEQIEAEGGRLLNEAARKIASDEAYAEKYDELMKIIDRKVARIERLYLE